MKMFVLLVVCLVALSAVHGETEREEEIYQLESILKRLVGQDESKDANRRQQQTDRCLCPSMDDKTRMVNLCTANPTLMCDGKFDCYDGRDQYACPCVCPGNQGADKVDLCANPDKLCDGVQDCVDARDEVGCFYDQYKATYKAAHHDRNMLRLSQGIGYDWKRIFGSVKK